MSIPIVIHVFLVVLLMPETPRYLLSKGKTSDALEVLKNMARKNGQSLPENFTLIPDEELASTSSEELSFTAKLKTAWTNSHIRRSLIGIVLVGTAIRFFLSAINFVKTELIYLYGETNSQYCEGVTKRTYLLDGRDYLLLLACQVTSDLISCTTLIFQNKLNCNLKILGLISYGICIVMFSFFFLCPNAWVAVVIISVGQIFNYNLVVNLMLSLSGLLPTNIRSTMSGICFFIMYLPLPLMPFAIQTLAKVSVHYVTSLCLGFSGLGLIGSIILPAQIYAN